MPILLPHEVINPNSSDFPVRLRELISDVSSHRRAEILQQMEALQFSEKETVFLIQDKADCVYFIQSGEILTEVVSGNGKQTYFRLLAVGDVLGFYAVFAKSVRSATAKAVKDSVLFKMPAELFINLVCQSPSLAQKYLQHLASLLQVETHRLARISAYPQAEKRLADEILERYKLSNPIHLPNMSSLGSYLALSRETTTRILKKWQNKGWIEKKPTGWFVANLKAFEDILLAEE
jgi:CRP/FNR family transcriptional regulator, cyclic AMP receptor protein